MTLKKVNSQDALIRHLAKLLDETHLTEIEIDSDHGRIRVARQILHPMSAAIPGIHSQENQGLSSSSAPLDIHADENRKSRDFQGTHNFDHHRGAVKAPMVGTTYLAPTPEAPPFVTEGATVQQGDTLVIIEAMKFMNPIKAPQGGVVTKILCQNAEPVEFNQVLMIIEPVS